MREAFVIYNLTSTALNLNIRQNVRPIPPGHSITIEHLSFVAEIAASEHIKSLLQSDSIRIVRKLDDIEVVTYTSANASEIVPARLSDIGGGGGGGYYLLLSGGTMSGNLNMGDHNLSNVHRLTVNEDAIFIGPLVICDSSYFTTENPGMGFIFDNGAQGSFRITPSGTTIGFENTLSGGDFSFAGNINLDGNQLNNVSIISGVASGEATTPIDFASPIKMHNWDIDMMGGFVKNARKIDGYGGSLTLRCLSNDDSHRLEFSSGYLDFYDVKIEMRGNDIRLFDGTGAGGGSIFMDGGTINFSGLDGNYSTPSARIACGTQNNGGDGGVSLFCTLDYELNWQAGRLDFVNGGTVLLRGATLNMNDGSGNGGGGNISMDGGQILQLRPQQFATFNDFPDPATNEGVIVYQVENKNVWVSNGSNWVLLG